MVGQGIARRAAGDNLRLSPAGPGHTDRCRAYRVAYRERHRALTASVCCCTREDPNSMNLDDEGATLTICDARGARLLYMTLAYAAVSRREEPELVRFAYSVPIEFDADGFPTAFGTRYARLVVEELDGPDAAPASR